MFFEFGTRFQRRKFKLIFKKSGYLILGTAMEGSRDFSQMSYPLKVILIIGNEGNGINDEIMSITDTNIKIPLYGEIESLNASVAAGIILYEIGRQIHQIID